MSGPYFHGTYELFPTGHRMAGRGDAYHKEWSVLSHYEALHVHIPEGMTAHKDGVFLCDNLDDIDNCGGATVNVSLMRPVGPVSRHDLNWSSHIDVLLEQRVPLDAPEMRQLCLNYWNGVASENPLWEYIAREVIVIASAEFEDADVLYDFVETEDPDEGFRP